MFSQTEPRKDWTGQEAMMRMVDRLETRAAQTRAGVQGKLGDWMLPREAKAKIDTKADKKVKFKR
jgi:hypothetical protein